MAVPPRATPERQQEEQDDDDDFTFPTPPPQPQLLDKDRHRVFHLPCSSSASSSPPVRLMLSCSSPIRRSFSAADCAASPWRARTRGARSPALSHYAADGFGFCDGKDEEEEEERMDSLWEDLNNDDDDAAAAGDGQFLGFLDVSSCRSVGGAGARERARKAAKEREAAVLGASRSWRRRPPGLVGMMCALRRMFVAHKGRNKVHRDEQSTASASAASPSPSSRSNNLSKK